MKDDLMRKIIFKKFCFLFSLLKSYNCKFVTNSRKNKKTITNVQRSWPGNIYNTLNYIRSEMCLLMFSPPFTASTRGEQRQLALELWDVNTSDQELLTPSYCPRCLL